MISLLFHVSIHSFIHSDQVVWVCMCMCVLHRQQTGRAQESTALHPAIWLAERAGSRAQDLVALAGSGHSLGLPGKSRSGCLGVWVCMGREGLEGLEQR